MAIPPMLESIGILTVDVMTKKRKTAKKIKLGKQGKRTKWAPFWVVLKKYGTGKRVHPSRMTRTRRSWTRTKLKIKPRRIRKKHLG